MPYSYRSLTQALGEVGIQAPAYEAALLLETFVGVSGAGLMTDRDRLYTSSELEEAVSRRLSREPLQYILGTWEFYGCRFRVNPHCLIPRSDTELLVETAVRCLPRGARVLDLCTGSGCVAVATLVHRPDVTAYALELYPETLELARENATQNGVSDRFIPVRADLLTQGVAILAPQAPFDGILSNPPYIPTEVIHGLAPEVKWEPVAALDGGVDGLCFYHAILRDYSPLVKPEGHILLEMAYDQEEDLRRLGELYLPGAQAGTLCDLGGNPRVIHFTLSEA